MEYKDSNAMESLEALDTGAADAALERVYASDMEVQKKRIRDAIRSCLKWLGNEDDCPLYVFSAPGRTEIGGNHTDHQYGKVLAAAIDRDTLAVVSPREDSVVRIISEGYGETVVDLKQLEPIEEEKGTTAALLRGVAAGVARARGAGLPEGDTSMGDDRPERSGGARNGNHLKGFDAWVTSDVPGGSGLSSSAAFEVLMGTIFAELSGEETQNETAGLQTRPEDAGLPTQGTAQSRLTPEEIAVIGQYAENRFFEKPCGLMDQMACSVGGLCAMDFREPQAPAVRKIGIDLDQYGYVLCITNTGGSHADLTDEYAAIPAEMRLVAEHFGLETLRDVTEEMLLAEAPGIRRECGDRAFLRAVHFVRETERARGEAEALEQGDFRRFLELFRESARSSFQYLQNITVPRLMAERTEGSQSMAVGLAVSDMLLGGEEAARVHGGGFAGTIQAFVKRENAEEYRSAMDRIFGEGACGIYRIRGCGGIRVM